MQEIVEYIARSLVDNPEAVRVRTVEGEKSIIFELKVAPSDVGRVIGRQGRTARAIRTVAKTAGGQSGKLVHVEILD